MEKNKVSRHDSILSDPTFRKTPQCGYYNDRCQKHVPYPSFSPICTSITEFNSLFKNEFQSPLLVDKYIDIGMKMLPSNTTLHEISEWIGPSTSINIMEVGSQSEITGWSFAEYVEYLTKRTPDHKVLNLISLEFSKTRLASKIEAPSIVRKIDWINALWPIERRQIGDFPRVQKYFLCGMAGSYTDFHIDFGGTSVWYHVLSGHKRFYLIEPTLVNLKLFQSWNCSNNQNEVFLGDVVSQCYQVDILPGQTFLIPSGWIHAVYTPKDSLVFGGNFLHCFSILKQLQSELIETNTNIAKKYRFPYFKQINWYAIVTFLPYAIKFYEEKVGLKVGSNSSYKYLFDKVALFTEVDEEYDDGHEWLTNCILSPMNDKDDNDDANTSMDANNNNNNNNVNDKKKNKMDKRYSTFHQFPFLLRMFEYWLSAGVSLLRGSDSLPIDVTASITNKNYKPPAMSSPMSSPTKSKSKNALTSPSHSHNSNNTSSNSSVLSIREVLDCWWMLLLEYATYLDSRQQQSSSSSGGGNTSRSDSNTYLSHIQRVGALKSTDWLDERVVYGEQQETAIDINPDTNIASQFDSQSSNMKIEDVATSVNNASTNKSARLPEPSASSSSSSLILRLPRPPNRAITALKQQQQQQLLLLLQEEQSAASFNINSTSMNIVADNNSSSDSSINAPSSQSYKQTANTAAGTIKTENSPLQLSSSLSSSAHRKHGSIKLSYDTSEMMNDTNNMHLLASSDVVAVTGQSLLVSYNDVVDGDIGDDKNSISHFHSSLAFIDKNSSSSSSSSILPSYNTIGSGGFSQSMRSASDNIKDNKNSSNNNSRNTAKPYSTRGHRLSAEFLSLVSDVHVEEQSHDQNNDNNELLGGNNSSSNSNIFLSRHSHFIENNDSDFEMSGNNNDAYDDEDDNEEDGEDAYIGDYEEDAEGYYTNTKKKRRKLISTDTNNNNSSRKVKSKNAHTSSSSSSSGMDIINSSSVSEVPQVGSITKTTAASNNNNGNTKKKPPMTSRQSLMKLLMKGGKNKR